MGVHLELLLLNFCQRIVEFLRELDKHKNEQDFVDESTIMNYITEVFDGRTSNFTVKELDPLKVFSEILNVRRRATY